MLLDGLKRSLENTPCMASRPSTSLVRYADESTHAVPRPSSIHLQLPLERTRQSPLTPTPRPCTRTIGRASLSLAYRGTYETARSFILLRTPRLLTFRSSRHETQRKDPLLAIPRDHSSHTHTGPIVDSLPPRQQRYIGPSAVSSSPESIRPLYLVRRRDQNIHLPPTPFLAGQSQDNSGVCIPIGPS